MTFSKNGKGENKGGAFKQDQCNGAVGLLSKTPRADWKCDMPDTRQGFMFPSSTEVSFEAEGEDVKPVDEVTHTEQVSNSLTVLQNMHSGMYGTPKKGG